jgi:preprotein translocase subunit SecA
MNKQREVIYKQRMRILEQDHLRDIVSGMTHDLVDFMMDTYCPTDQIPEDWDIKALLEYGEHVFLTPHRLQEEELRRFDREELRTFLVEQIEIEYVSREEHLGEFMRELERIVLIRTVDSKWMDHIDAMDHLRQGIHLRSYGQIDPLTAYQREGFDMFHEMIHSIQEEVSTYVFKAEMTMAELPPETPEPLYTS